MHWCIDALRQLLFKRLHLIICIDLEEMVDISMLSLDRLLWNERYHGHAYVIWDSDDALLWPQWEEEASQTRKETEVTWFLKSNDIDRDPRIGWSLPNMCMSNLNKLQMYSRIKYHYYVVTMCIRMSAEPLFAGGSSSVELLIPNMSSILALLPWYQSLIQIQSFRKWCDIWIRLFGLDYEEHHNVINDMRCPTDFSRPYYGTTVWLRIVGCISYSIFRGMYHIQYVLSEINCITHSSSILSLICVPL